MSVLEPELKEHMANHMAHVHSSVTAMSVRFLEAERRNNYVTPKSFLELIALYKSMLTKKLDQIVDGKQVNMNDTNQPQVLHTSSGKSLTEHV